MVTEVQRKQDQLKKEQKKRDQLSQKIKVSIRWYFPVLHVSFCCVGNGEQATGW